MLFLSRLLRELSAFDQPLYTPDTYILYAGAHDLELLELDCKKHHLIINLKRVLLNHANESNVFSYTINYGRLRITLVFRGLVDAQYRTMLLQAAPNLSFSSFAEKLTACETQSTVFIFLKWPHFLKSSLNNQV